MPHGRMIGLEGPMSGCGGSLDRWGGSWLVFFFEGVLVGGWIGFEGFWG